jgi:hypothetical protein
MLQLAYYILLFAILISIGFAFERALVKADATSEGVGRFIGGYTGLMLLFIVFIAALALTGVYQTTAMPPRLALLAVLPAFAIIVYFFTAKRFKEIIAAFPMQFTIYFQSFRIVVELLIYWAVLEGLGPELVSFNGRNFDILAGLTAPLIGWAYTRRIISKNILLVWNIFCLLLLANIVFIFISLLINPVFWGYESTPISMNFLTIPYVYLAAVYMPVAVFLHVMCITKIVNQGRG